MKTTSSSVESGGLLVTLSGRIAGSRGGADSPQNAALKVRYKVPLDGEHLPAGWVYASGRTHGIKRSLCVFFWRDGTWMLAEESVPGFYGDKLATGRMWRAFDEEFAVAQGFPHDALQGATTLYCSGDIEVEHAGRLLRHVGCDV